MSGKDKQIVIHALEIPLEGIRLDYSYISLKDNPNSKIRLGNHTKLCFGRKNWAPWDRLRFRLNLDTDDISLYKVLTGQAGAYNTDSPTWEERTAGDWRVYSLAATMQEISDRKLELLAEKGIKTGGLVEILDYSSLAEVFWIITDVVDDGVWCRADSPKFVQEIKLPFDTESVIWTLRGSI